MAKRKAFTEKDVIAAMQVGGQRMVKTIRHSQRSKPIEFHLSPSGQEVGPRTAEKVINAPEIAQANDGLFEGLSQQYVWQG